MLNVQGVFLVHIHVAVNSRAFVPPALNGSCVSKHGEFIYLVAVNCHICYINRKRVVAAEIARGD